MNRKRYLTAATLMIFGLAHADQNFYMPCGKDMAFSEGSIGGPVPTISTLECGAECNSKPKCLSFTYNKDSRQCQLSSKIADSCDEVSKEQGAIYIYIYIYIHVCVCVWGCVDLSMDTQHLKIPWSSWDL